MSINDTPEGGILTMDEAENLLRRRPESLEQQSKTVRPWISPALEYENAHRIIERVISNQENQIKDLEARLERAEKAIERIIFG